jgi:Methyltransferase domain
MNDSAMFAVRPEPIRMEECGFYHTMDIPGYGTTKGLWDLRNRTDEYLGQYSFSGKRVLEIGPASGFLTFEMEGRGASVVGVDVKPDPGWDFVPYPDSVLEPIYANRRIGMDQMRNSFWFAHRAFNSKAKIWYGDVYQLPEALGRFDVAVMAAVLLHVHSPLLIMAQCAKRASALIITDLLYEDLEGRPICRLHPTAENQSYDTWWHLTSDIIRQFASVLGFTNFTTSKHSHPYQGHECQFFTVVASK